MMNKKMNIHGLKSPKSTQHTKHMLIYIQPLENWLQENWQVLGEREAIAVEDSCTG